MSSPPLILEKLTTRDGLPQGTVRVTLQDSQGFIWLGTEDGLVKFDGRDVYRYGYSPGNSAGLSGNFINSIVEDKKGDLWIAVKGGGLACWHRATDSFTTYRHNPAGANSLSSDAVRTLLLDSSGFLWVGTLDAGIDIIDPARGDIRHIRHDAARSASLADDQVQTIVQDHTGTVWVGTHVGLDRVHPGTDQFVHYALQGGASLPAGAQVSQIVEDGSDSLWIATFDAGLFRIDRQGSVTAHFRNDRSKSASLSSNDVRAVLDDQAGHLWVATSEGLDLLDRTTGEFAHYRHDKGDPDSLSDSFVMSLYQDPTGLVWIGTLSGGVNRWDPHSWELGATRPSWLDGKLVTAFADAGEGRVWVSSLGGGLMQFDPRTGESISLDDLMHQRNVLPDSRVMSLHEDRRGSLWIGTMANGLKQLTHERLTSVPVQPGDAHSLSAAGIVTIYEAHNGALWIGTHGGGANIFDPVTGIVQQLPFGSTLPQAVSAKNVTAFLEDRQGNIWIGTDSGGLDLARPDGAVVKVFKHDPSSSESLSANTVYSLALDTAGRIWIGTDGGGLDLVLGTSSDPDAIRFQNFGRAEGLSSETVYGILPDSLGRLWLSGNAGLMYYDPVSRATKTYHHEQGLQGEEFDSGAFFRTRDGRLCFGGPGGFNIFDPAQLYQRQGPPRLALTRVEALGAPLQSPTPYWALERIDLSYRANIVALDFAVLDFTSPNRNQLSYRMAGLTDKWIALGALRRVTLTNLDAGDHVLEVSAGNADGVWSTKPLRLVIHRDAAPWRSKAAFSAYAALLMGLVFLGLRAQRRKLLTALKAQQSLESEVALRTQELRESNGRLEEANDAKSNFLARMGHELRTPMNGVIGMIELLARSPLSASQVRQTQSIRSSAATLLQILNDLLDLSKLQARRVDLESLPVDFVQLCEECVTVFSGAAEIKRLGLIFCPPQDDYPIVEGDPLRLRQILMNLIGNAIKFTEQGEIVVSCKLQRENNGNALLTLSVTDTGIGMSEAVHAKIFEPFTQADETTTRRFGGTGLGLSLCQRFIQLMGGSISVVSAPQTGSTFVVSLRLKEASQAKHREVALPAGTRVGILTRHPALHEAMRGYLSWFTDATLIVVCGAADFTFADADIFFVDADSCADAVDRFRKSGAAVRRQLIVLSNTAAIEAQDLETCIFADQILRKPCTRDALRAALAAVAHGRIAAAPSMTTDVASATPRRGHALIVEDDSINSAVAEGFLAALGYTSVSVESGAAAVARSAVERFDVILMDLNMPGLDGYETASLIRRSEAPGVRVPIIALTANSADSAREFCLLSGIDDILTKPYSLTECADMMRRWTQGGPRRTPSDEELNALCAVDAVAVSALGRVKSGANKDLYPQLVSLFDDSSSVCVEQMRQALLERDFQTTSFICHKLKAAAGNVGAFAFSSLLDKLERTCAMANAADALDLFERISTVRPLLCEKLRQLTTRATA